MAEQKDPLDAYVTFDREPRPLAVVFGGVLTIAGIAILITSIQPDGVRVLGAEGDVYYRGLAGVFAFGFQLGMVVLMALVTTWNAAPSVSRACIRWFLRTSLATFACVLLALLFDWLNW